MEWATTFTRLASRPFTKAARSAARAAMEAVGATRQRCTVHPSRPSRSEIPRK